MHIGLQIQIQFRFNTSSLIQLSRMLSLESEWTVDVVNMTSSLFCGRFDEEERVWNGILREIQYTEGASILGVRLNVLRLHKL